MATMNQKIRGRVIAWGVLLGLFVLAFIMSACSASKDAIAVAGSPPSSVLQATATTPAETPATTLPGGGGVAADAPAPSSNCAELDPKKWAGFTWEAFENAEQTEHWITLWNNSPCDRVTTWRAFAVGAGNAQTPAGPDMLITVSAMAGFGAPGTNLSRPYRFKVVYYGDGLPPCGALIQIDGRAGVVRDMRHENASFTFGRLFRILRSCVPPFTPPKTVCVDPAFGPWVPVPTSAASIVAAMTVQECPKQQRSRVRCDGTVQIEPRPGNWCFEESGQ
jgi:hypothetical protein